MRHFPLLSLLLAAPAMAEVPTVMTDIAITQSLVAQVMGDLGQPGLLLDQGSDPHHYQLRPSQARALTEARLVFWIGPELTPWLDRALAGAAIQGEAVALLQAEGTYRRAYGGGAGDTAAAETLSEDHAAAGIDPHAWLSPDNARLWVAVIARALAEADPDNAAAYAANAAAAAAGIDALEAELAGVLAAAAGRPLYVYHDAYGYFAEAFGLTIAGTLAEGDATAPGAARLRALLDAIAAQARPCIFAEAGHSGALIGNLLEGTGLVPGLLDPEGAGQAPGADHYAATLRALAAEIAACAAAP